MTKRITFGLIGGGWRAEFFLRIARALPERFGVTGFYSRTEAKRTKFAQAWELNAVASVEALVATKPDFVVLSVPRGVSAELILELAQLGMPVLGETPPAEKIDDLTHLWQALPKGAKVQIAEQYPFQPLHAARLTLARSGKLGVITQAQISAAHNYHGVVLLRRFLGVGFEPALIEAGEFTSPIVQSRGRDGGPAEEKIVSSRQVIARLRFGDKLGVYDFTGDQYFSWVRSQRMLIRGERGEINNLDASYLADFKTPVYVHFDRHDAGQHGNLEGYHHQGYLAGGEWLYRNPFIPARLADDEIAIASCLEAMAHYVETGEDFYSLAEGCQDHYLGLLIEDAAKSTALIQSTRPVWCP